MKSCTYYKHDFSQFDEQKFISDFDTMDWSNMHDDKTDLNKNFDDFHAKVSSCVEQNASLKNVSKGQLKLKLNPSFNKGGGGCSSRPPKGFSSITFEQNNLETSDFA